MWVFPVIACIVSGISRGPGLLSTLSNELQSVPTILSAFGVKNVIVAVAVLSVRFPLKLYLYT